MHVRRWIIGLSVIGAVLFAAGCNTPPSNGSPTGRPIVPTRVIPTITDTPTATITPSPLPTDTPTLTLTQTATTTPTETATHTSTVTSTTSALVLTETPTPTQSISVVTPTVPATPLVFEDATSYQLPPLISAIAYGETITGELSSQQPALIYPFEGQAGDVIDIALTNADTGLDPLLIVLTSKGQEIARNDDETPEVRSSLIRALRLPENDTYYIVATRYLARFGLSEGIFTLTLDQSTAPENPFGLFSVGLAYDKLAVGYLDETQSEQIYTFRANAGDVIDIDMRILNDAETLDPYLGMTDNLGSVLISSDDVGNGSINARIDDFVVPRDGYYSIVAARFVIGDNPNEGEYDLVVTLVSDRGKSGDYAIDAQLNPQNSRIIRSDQRLFIGTTAGDIILDDGSAELRAQSLITFELPPDLTLENVASAELNFSTCYILGGGFEALGDLAIYQDPYGAIDPNRDLTRPSVGARIVATVSDCSPIDMTEIVTTALENGETSVQFRLTFRTAENNGESDQIRFVDPRLQISIVP